MALCIDQCYFALLRLCIVQVVIPKNRETIIYFSKEYMLGNQFPNFQQEQTQDLF